LQAAHTSAIADASMAGDDVICSIGVDIDRDTNPASSTSSPGTISMKATATKPAVVDLLLPKLSAIRLGIDAAITVLKVDQIIMSKQAGGSKPPGS
jgi:hypothetical protein